MELQLKDKNTSNRLIEHFRKATKKAIISFATDISDDKKFEFETEVKS